MNTPEAINDPLAQELLEKEALLRIAYLGLDKEPRVVPMGFLWNGTEVVVCTAASAPKVKALSRNHHVAVTIDTATPSARQLLIRGIAKIDVVDGVPSEYTQMNAKVLDPAQLKGFEDQARKTYKQMVLIKIKPTWARVYDFNAGRVPEFLRKLG